MSDVNTILRTLLLTDATVAGCVGERIYPHQRVEGSGLPALVYHRTGTRRRYSMDAQVNAVVGEYELYGAANTMTALRALADAVRRRLSSYSGTVAAQVVLGIFIDGEADEYEPATGAGSQPIYGFTMGLTVHYQES